VIPSKRPIADETNLVNQSAEAGKRRYVPSRVATNEAPESENENVQTTNNTTHRKTSQARAAYNISMRDLWKTIRAEGHTYQTSGTASTKQCVNFELHGLTNLRKKENFSDVIVALLDMRRISSHMILTPAVYERRTILSTAMPAM
jgi:hypothetical protein